MITNLMPDFQQTSDGTRVAVWPDESDSRWLIATFLRSDIGYSATIADDILQGLDAILTGNVDSWQWDGSSFRILADRRGCCLELCESELPSHIRPVLLQSEELKEIVARWKKWTRTQK